MNNEEAIEQLNNICFLKIELESLNLTIGINNPPDPRFPSLMTKIFKSSSSSLKSVELYFEGNQELEQDVSQLLYPLQYCHNLRYLKLIGDAEMNIIYQFDVYDYIGYLPKLYELIVIHFYVDGEVTVGDLFKSVRKMHFDMNENARYKEAPFVKFMEMVREREPFETMYVDEYTYEGTNPYLCFLTLIEASKLLQFEITSSIIGNIYIYIYILIYINKL